MFAERQLGRLPLPPGEGWGEGALDLRPFRFSAPCAKPPAISRNPAGPVAAALLRPCSLPCYGFGRGSLAKSCSSLEGFYAKKIRPTALGTIAFLLLPGKPVD